MYLLADISNEAAAIIAILSGTLGTGVAWAAKFIINRQTRQREWAKADEKGIVDHLNDTVRRLIGEVEALQRDITGLRGQFTQAIAHVMYLEGIMESKGIPFRPFPRAAIGGSSEHEAVQVPDTPDPAAADATGPKSSAHHPRGGPR